MSANDYRFVTRWHLDATPDQVFDILHEPMEYTRWWPDVWLDAELLDGGTVGDVGRRVRFHSRGWLPYTLRWTAETVAVTRPTRISVRASGDFEGSEWTLRALDATRTEAEYLWTITANKPLLKYSSPLLRPLFEWNHRWAMTRGEESIRTELRRRNGDPSHAKPREGIARQAAKTQECSFEESPLVDGVFAWSSRQAAGIARQDEMKRLALQRRAKAPSGQNGAQGAETE